MDNHYLLTRKTIKFIHLMSINISALNYEYKKNIKKLV